MKWFKGSKKEQKQENESYPLCVEILEHKLQKKDMLYENYEGERVLQILMTEKEIIDIWNENKNLRFICNNIEEKGIEQMLERMKQKTKEINQSVRQLRIEEKTLREEIINFSKVVTELSQRYKLSPTWEGKKPIMIEKQKQLEERKNTYEKKEKIMNQKLQNFHGDYQQMQSFFYIEVERYVEHYKRKHQYP